MAEDRKAEGMTGETADGFGSFDPKSVDPYIVKDPEALAINLARTVENLGKAASAWLAPRESGEKTDLVAEPVADMVKTLSKVSEYWISDPQRTLEAQTHLLGSYFSIWSRTLQKMSGETVADPADIPRNDKRFCGCGLGEEPVLRFSAAGLSCDRRLGRQDGAGCRRAGRTHPPQGRISTSARFPAHLSPANFVTTNPQLYRETVASSGANLVKGMQMLAEDIAAGKGDLRLRQTDTSKFAVGENMAITPGKVIAQSDVCQIIQYDAVDGNRAEASAADLPALDQQILRARSQSAEVLHQMVRGPGADGVRHLLGQPR